MLGWLRVVVLGNLFGATAELDAYYAAFRIPDLVFQLVAAGAIASALVPVLAGLTAHGERERAWRVASTVLNLMLGVLLVLAALLAVFAPPSCHCSCPASTPTTTQLTVQLTRLMLVSPVFLAAGAIASAILNTEDRFGAAAMAPVAYNLGIIVCAVLLAPWLGVYAAAIGVVVGSAAHLLVQLPALRGRFHYSPRADIGDEAARQSFWLMLPRAIGLGANQITFLVNTALASTLGGGRRGRLQRGLQRAPDPARRHRPAARHRAAADDVAGARQRRGSGLRQHGRAAPCACCCGPCCWSRPWASWPATRSSSCSSAGASTPGGPGRHGRDAGRLPAGPAGARAQRHPGAGLLQRQGHHHAGERGHRLGRRQRRRLARHRGAPGAGRPGAGHRRRAPGSRRSR